MVAGGVQRDSAVQSANGLPVFGGDSSSGIGKGNHPLREVIVRLSLQVMVPPEHKLWWPAGYGAPALYDLHVAYQPSEAGGRFTTTQIRVGFRSIRLVQARRSPSSHDVVQYCTPACSELSCLVPFLPERASLFVVFAAKYPDGRMPVCMFKSWILCTAALQ